jgi:hypothetical protein
MEQWAQLDADSVKRKSNRVLLLWLRRRKRFSASQRAMDTI